MSEIRMCIKMSENSNKWMHNIIPTKSVYTNIYRNTQKKIYFNVVLISSLLFLEKGKLLQKWFMIVLKYIF